MGFRDRVKRGLRRRIEGLRPRDLTRGPEPQPILPAAEDGYHAVASSTVVTEDKPRTFEVGGQTVAVFRVGGELFAIDDACTHEDAPLGESTDIKGHIITCPYHDWRYDLRDGQCLTDPDRPVSCFAVREREGLIWVGGITRQGSSDRGGDHA